MTVKDKLVQNLINLGMSESQSKEVVDLSIPELQKLINGYSITFYSDCDDYPDVIYGAMMNYIKPIALKWIEENKPEAWFKEMFI